MKVPTRTDRAERRSAGARRILGRLAVSAVATTMLLGAALPAHSAVGIDIEIAPPAPRVVEVPPPRAGFVWAPGYYRWDGHQHVWVEGRWLRERRGFRWVPEHWSERHGRYHFEPGHWARG